MVQARKREDTRRVPRRSKALQLQQGQTAWERERVGPRRVPRGSEEV